MELPLSSQLASRLIVLPECGSTNDELLTRASDPAARQDWPDFSVLVTTNQTRGRGRLGREWVAPPGQGLAVSVLLCPMLPNGEPLGLEHYSWLPLIAGLAMTKTVAALVPGSSVSLKWPNDVLIDGLKVSGLLADLLPGGNAIVQGAGLNLAIPEGQLPTATSTSLILHRTTEAKDERAETGSVQDDAAVELIDTALAGYLRELRLGCNEFLGENADPEASGISGQLHELCSTFGQRVRVELPDGDALFGTATGVDRAGRLRVTNSEDGQIQTVAAGDVTHLRYE